MFLLLSLLSLPVAEAGRPYAFVEGIDSLHRTGLEIESWTESYRPSNAEGPGAEWWTGPVVGVTDQLEVGLFGIFVQPPTLAEEDHEQEGADPEEEEHEAASSTFLTFDTFRVQVSYLLAERGTWPVDVRMRGQVGLPIAGHYTVWLSSIVSRDFGKLNLTGNVGGYLEFEDQEIEPYITAGLGSSMALGKGVRVGSEVFGEAEPEEDGGWEVLTYAGPTIAYGLDRFWLSTCMGFGLTDDSVLRRGRIVVGLLF